MSLCNSSGVTIVKTLEARIKAKAKAEYITRIYCRSLSTIFGGIQ